MFSWWTSGRISRFLWLPQQVSPRLVLERLKIPHHDAFAFGERLAVVEREESTLTEAYERIGLKMPE